MFKKFPESRLHLCRSRACPWSADPIFFQVDRKEDLNPFAVMEMQTRREYCSVFDYCVLHFDPDRIAHIHAV